MRLRLYTIDNDYLNYLRQFDSRIPCEHLQTNAKKRPYIGILIMVNNIKYVIPISSPKQKHKLIKTSIDNMLIDNGKYGIINFNNMIPLPNNCDVCKLISLSKKSLTNQKDINYVILLQKETDWINKILNRKAIIIKANNLRSSYIYGKLINNHILNRCCNFPLLEQVKDNFKKV